MTNQIAKIDFRSEEYFQNIVEDCRAIVVERSFNSRIEIVQGKWEVGQRISVDSDYQKNGKGSGKFIEQLGEEIKLSPSDIYDCIKIYDQYPKLNLLFDKFGKNISWFKIREELLGRRNEKRGTDKVCYRIEGILEAFKKWFEQSKTTVADEAVDEFKKYLIAKRK